VLYVPFCGQLQHQIHERRRFLTSARGTFLEISVIDNGTGINEIVALRPGHGIENTRERLLEKRVQEWFRSRTTAAHSCRRVSGRARKWCEIVKINLVNSGILSFNWRANCIFTFSVRG
jgi:hypothetical protein